MRADLFAADLPPIRHILESRPPIEPSIASRLAAPRFQRVYCSQCGRGFGPRDNGFSSCVSHAHLRGV
jgi:hypothetical protein